MTLIDSRNKSASIILVTGIIAFSEPLIAEILVGKPPLVYGDIAQEIKEATLPPFKLDPQSLPGSVASSTQVMTRTGRLGLSLSSARKLDETSGLDIEELATLYKTNARPISLHHVIFEGTRLSELEPFIADDTFIEVRSPAIQVDKTLQIKGRRITLDFGRTNLSPSKDWNNTHMKGISNAALVLNHAEEVTIKGGHFEQIEAIVVTSSQSIGLLGVEIEGSPGYGIIIAPHSLNILVANSRIMGSHASGIAIMQKVQKVLLSHNVITDGLGTSNHNAGILITDRRKYKVIGGSNFLLHKTTLRDGSEIWHFPQEDPILNRKSPPTYVYVIDNEITKNAASGIYLDGATQTYVRGNTIIGNAKEGICLDNGATANVIVGNDIIANGNRWGQSDHTLEVDFVAQYGRMEDGTANAKLPGISIDNAIFNIVTNNSIGGNFGSGIKMVRTAFYNVVGRNSIRSNNRGSNNVFFFFGIEVGGAVADSSTSDLDFTPSMGNVIFQNIITGPHYAGIQFCPQCDYNDIFDNVIIHPTNWAIEQTNPKGKNIFLNNFSPSHSRNANLNGTSGRVLIGGESYFD